MTTKGERRENKRRKSRFGMQVSGSSTKKIERLIQRRADGDMPDKRKVSKRKSRRKNKGK